MLSMVIPYFVVVYGPYWENHRVFRFSGGDRLRMWPPDSFSQGQGRLTAGEYGPGVDLMHQVVSAHFQVFDTGQAYRPGVVHQGIDTAKITGGFVYSLADLSFIPHVQYQR